MKYVPRNDLPYTPTQPYYLHQPIQIGFIQWPMCLLCRSRPDTNLIDIIFLCQLSCAALRMNVLRQERPLDLLHAPVDLHIATGTLIGPDNHLTTTAICRVVPVSVSEQFLHTQKSQDQVYKHKDRVHEWRNLIRG